MCSMIKTAKEWAEVFAKIAEKNPDEKVWAYTYTKSEVEVYNSPEADKEITPADWENLVNEFERICDTGAGPYSRRLQRYERQHRVDIPVIIVVSNPSVLKAVVFCQLHPIRALIRRHIRHKFYTKIYFPSHFFTNNKLSRFM